MLARLVAFALGQRLLVAVLALVLAGGGVLAFRDLPIDAFPDVSPTQVKVIMKAPGMTPEEVEARIVQPIELELLGVPNKRVVRSVAKYAIADVTLDFVDGTDIWWARQQVNERLAGVLKDFPAGVTGGLAPITTPLGEMFMFTIEGGDLTLAERRTLLDWTLRPLLRTIPGVAEVNSLGGHVRAFEVVPDDAAMLARGVTLELLSKALEANNRNEGAGRLADGEEALVVRTVGNVRSLADVERIVVKRAGGTPVRVADVATVRLGALTRYGAVTRDGRGEAVQGLVLGLRGANARAVVEAVRAKLDETAATLPPGVRIDVFYDRGDLVTRAVATVEKALAEAMVLVVLLLLAFLGGIRAAVAVALMLPMAVLATFLAMRWAGLSANLMSLGGLAIAIGMLVDSAVVVVENVVARLGEDGSRDRLAVIRDAVTEVAVPVTSGILIIGIVFLPLLTLEGLEGKLFIPVALTIVFALASSLVLALTLIPVASSVLLRGGAHAEPWLMRKLAAAYRPALEAVLRHGRLALAAAVLLLAGAAALYPFIGKTFLPTLDEGDMIVQLEKLPSIGLEESLATDGRVQRALMEAVPEIRTVVSRTGADELGLDPMGLNQTDTFVVLKPREAWRRPDKAWVIDQVRETMQRFTGLGHSFTQPIEMRVSEMLTGVRGDVAVKIFGPDLATLNDLVRKVEALLKQVPGSEDVFTVTNEGVQYLSVEVDRLAAGRFGLDVETIGHLLHTRLEGAQLGIVMEGGRRTPLLLRAAEGVRVSPERFASHLIPLGDGATVALGAVATIRRVDGPVKIDRENAERYAVVQTSVAGRDLVGFVDEARARVSSTIPLPPGYRIVWGGQFENQQRAAARLALVVPVALALIFLILYTTFGSLRLATLVILNVPFALIGGIVALWIAGEYLSVPASVGFIALLGIAVLNGVVLVSHYLALGTTMARLDEIVVHGAMRRLRPILMTASIAALGLVPLLFATGPGSEIQRPLAIVVIGGLFSSTPLTLFLVPILYRRFGPRPSAAPAPAGVPA